MNNYEINGGNGEGIGLTNELQNVSPGSAIMAEESAVVAPSRRRRKQQSSNMLGDCLCSGALFEKRVT